MRDLVAALERAGRSVREHGLPGLDRRTVRLHRRYDAPVEDVWRACTDPERLARWFLPVTGDLRPGGSYQLEENAGGEVRECEAPRRLVLSWVLGQEPPPEAASVVVLELRALGPEETELSLEHTVVAEEHWAEYGPGATGVGWDLALLGLDAHLRDDGVVAAGGIEGSPQAAAAMRRSAELWGAAHEAAGAAPDVALAAAARTADFYAPGS